MSSKEYVLPRDGEPSINFSGRALAEVSSYSNRKQAWTELKLYLTDGGNYILHVIGRTTRPDWVDIHSGSVHHEPAALIDALRVKRGGERKLSALALSLLDTAALQDDRILQALEDLEDEKERID